MAPKITRRRFSWRYFFICFFRASLGKFGQKSFAPPKICLLLHLCLSLIAESYGAINQLSNHACREETAPKVPVTVEHPLVWRMTCACAVIAAGFLLLSFVAMLYSTPRNVGAFTAKKGGARNSEDVILIKDQIFNNVLTLS